ncbi:hypothetical protein [Candidatus Foliamicus sp.]
MSEAPAQSASLTIREFFERVPERALFIFIGLLQGFIFVGLAESGDWLEARPMVYFPIWQLVTAWPLLFMLSFRRTERLRALVWVSGFCALLAALALYTGWQATPHGAFDAAPVAGVFGLSMFVASFVALLHLQSHVWRMERSYDTFFTLSWRNFVTYGLSTALTLALWLILILWASLFEAIGIDFFEELFDEAWFSSPVLTAVFAFGLSSFRDASSVIDTVSSLLARLTWLLLPLLLFIIAAFLLSLPFVDTDSGTTILMTANLLGLLFVNAVYQTGDRIPYPMLMHRILTAGIALLPILSALACYDIALEVAQDGWTVDHCWTLLIALLMACFSLGYLYLIIRQRTDWHGKLPEVNKFMSWVVLASLLLTASPLLDFRAISAASQFAPVEAGEATVYQLDTRYVKKYLARPGYLRIQSLQAELDATNPLDAQQLRTAYKEGRGARRLKLAWSEEQKATTIIRPDSIAVPESVWNSVRSVSEIEDPVPRLLIQTDLKANEQPEYVAVWLYDRGSERSIFAICLTWDDDYDLWRSCGSHRINSEQPMDQLLEKLVEAEIEAVVPAGITRDLRIGDWVFDL